jgi:hypothetical protein
MSITNPWSMRSYKSIWAYSANEMVRCLNYMMTSGVGATTYVPVMSHGVIEEFFSEVEEFAGDGTKLIYSDTYQLAIRVLCLCHETPGAIIFHGEPLSQEDLEKELAEIAEIYRSVMSGQTVLSNEEFDSLLRLVTFLHRLSGVEEDEYFAGHDCTIVATLN